ncbi:hypothetical protein N431DRAFT_455328 [Stipitochalara longipes BDJ]|nr:hypothetical protein N431DRAFT_455328 [Stipitochalara longipes BDJ]
MSTSTLKILSGREVEMEVEVEVEVEAAQSEAGKKDAQMPSCSDAQKFGASAVVVQKLIQRGKDKCRLRMIASKEALVVVSFAAPNDVRYPPVSSSCSSWTSRATRYRIYQHVSSRRAPTCPANPSHADKQWLPVKSWQNGLSPDVLEVPRESRETRASSMTSSDI